MRTALRSLKGHLRGAPLSKGTTWIRGSGRVRSIDSSLKRCYLVWTWTSAQSRTASTLPWGCSQWGWQGRARSSLVMAYYYVWLKLPGPVSPWPGESHLEHECGQWAERSRDERQEKSPEGAEARSTPVLRICWLEGPAQLNRQLCLPHYLLCWNVIVKSV